MSKSKQYFCFLQYFATGEGLTLSIGFVPAKSKLEAAKIFCKKHMTNGDSYDEEAIKYFSPCVVTLDLENKNNHAEIKGMMKSFFNKKTIDYMFEFKDKGLIDFYFKSYVNCS